MLAMFYWLAGHVAAYRQRAADAERLKMISLRDKAELEARLAEARNAYLQQQMSPHLLFNALNFIYTSVYKRSPEASRCVLLLSDIMRFSLEERAPDGKVMLNEEIRQLRRLEEINRFRYDHELYFELVTEEDFAQLRIIPLILFTLAENVFKHGDLGNREHPAHIFIGVDESGLLRFSSRNAIRERTAHAKLSQTGLQNIRVRLDFAYPSAYELNTNESAGVFELYLTLQL
jgi:LytS/YehU family sensor histidine kinase